MSRYRIERPLRRGGMAEVFEAVVLGDGGFERKIVLKQLHADDDDARHSFIDEARILSRLHHPGIVSVLDFGVLDGRPFQALEWVEGTDLRDLVEKVGTVPIEIALGIGLDLAEALAYAHAAVGADGRPLGLVHRDVAPDNVLVSWAGEVKLADFGIARANTRLARTQVGVAKGKIDFMAPEQALGGAVDARTDLYAVALVLHLAITGVSLLAQEPSRKAAWAGGALALEDGLDADVVAFLSRALKHRPDERFASARDMASALGDLFDARGGRDPRRARRKWLESIKPKAEIPQATSQRRALSMLLGTDALLDLVPPEEDPPTALDPVRFSPELEPAEETMPADPRTEPGTPRAISIAAPVLPPPVPPASGIMLPESGATPPSAISVPPLPPRVAPRSPARIQKRLWTWGPALVAAAALAVVAAAWLAARRAPPAPSPSIAAVHALDPPMARAATVSAQAPEPSITEPALVRPSPRPARPPPGKPALDAAAQRAQISAAASARGLTLAELDQIEPLADLLARHAGSELADAESQLPALIAAIASATIPTPVLGARLQRIHARMAKLAPTLAPTTLRALDVRYLDLQSAVRGSPGDTAELMRKIDALDRDVR